MKHPWIVEANKLQNESVSTGAENSPGLVGEERCREILFPDEASRPCRRTMRDWQAKKLIPYVRIGRRVFFDPAAVRRAIEKNFSVRSL